VQVCMQANVVVNGPTVQSPPMDGLLTDDASGWRRRSWLRTISKPELVRSHLHSRFTCNLFLRERPVAMQRYVPPHMRQRGGSSTSSARASPRPPTQDASSSSTRNVDFPAPPVSTAPQRFVQDTAPFLPSSRRAYDPRDTPLSRSALTSPASDIRSMRPSSGGRVQMDEMEMIQSVSRSGGDGAEGDAWVRL
jgi:hypothetical protein